MKLPGLLLASAFILSTSAMAQTEAPKPAPELKKLDMFAGSWTLDGNMKSGPMGPGAWFELPYAVSTRHATV